MNIYTPGKTTAAFNMNCWWIALQLHLVGFVATAAIVGFSFAILPFVVGTEPTVEHYCFDSCFHSSHSLVVAVDSSYFAAGIADSNLNFKVMCIYIH